MTSVALASTYSTGGQFIWTCPPGVTSVQVVCTAGGGGGSAAPSGTAGSNSGGGGGGESCYEPSVPVTPGVQYQVNVGPGGIGGITGGVEVGDVGGDSFFTGDGSFLVYAHGGQPGLASATGGGRGGAGGDGSQNIVSAAGGRGANAVASSNSGGGGGAAGVSTTAGFPGNSAVGASGGPTSGGTYAGGAGGAGLSTSGTGGNGVAPGGGGGGGFTTTTTGQSGGDGADGQVVLVYSITDPVILPASTLGSVTTFTAPLACTGVNAQAWGAGARGFPAAGGGAATVPNLVGSGSVIGSTCNPKVYNLTDYVAGANQLDSFCGVPVGLTMQKWYWGTTLPTTVGKLPAGLKALAAAGCSILSCFKPSQTLTTANLSNFVAGMKAMIAAGIQFDAILWQEANDGWFPSASAYHSYVNYYWNTVDPVSGVAANSLGIGLVFDPGFSSGQSSAISYYSGGPITGGPFNAVVCDWYCINGFGDGTGAPKHPLDPVAALADNDGIPFGLGEWGVTATPTPPADLFTGGAYQAYVNYIINFFQNRANRYAIVYYDGAHNTTFNVVTSASDPRAAGIAQVYNALATGSTSSAAGGGGGEYASVPSLSLTAGKSYAVVVGAGGSSSGKNGGNSTVQGDAALVVAHGGLGATSASVGGLGGTGSTNTVHHDGGQGGAGGNQGAGGGGGGSGGTSATGNPGLPGSIGGGGAAAVTGGGPGGNGGSSTSDGSPPAIGPGGGGGGRGITGNFNGQGYDGQVSLSSFVINGVGCAGSLGLAGITFQGTASAAQNGSFALAPIAFSAKGQVGKLTFVQAGTIASATSSVTLTCTSTKANSLVLACLVVNSNTALTAPAGWTRIVAQACSGATAGREEVWFYNPSGDGVTGANPGGITSAVFSSGGPSLAGHLLEFSPPAGYVPVLDGTPGSTSAAGPATSFPVTQSPGPTAGGDLGVSFFENRFSATTSGTWTTPTGWTQARQGSATANWQASFYNNLSSGAQSVTAGASTGTNETGWAASIVTFSISPLITSSGGLVLSGLGFHASGNAVVGPGQVVSSGGLQLAPLSFQSPSLANAFPLAGSLPIMVELQINGTWVDISDLVYQRDDITITGRGVPNEATVPQPAQCSMTLNNRGGVFSPQNASGPFFPYLIRNTRIRVSVVNVVSALGATYTGYRFQGEVPAWPVLWDETGQDIYVQITAVGILQRMAQSKSSASPLLRYYQGLTDGLIPAGYWPCEDGSQAGSFASGIPGGSPMTWGTPAPGLSADTSAAGSAAFAQLNGSAWTGTPGAFSSGGQTFQNPGTFTWFCPNGITSVDVQCWGAGGGGSNGLWGTGGAGGEFAEDTAIGVTPGNTYTFNVGFGGSGGAGAFQPNGNAGNKGGNTTFSGDSKKVRAHGGSGGPDSSSGSASGGTGSTNPIHFDGGNGSSNDAGNAGSGGGSSAGVSSSGHTGSHGSGQTGGAGGTAVAGGGPGGAGGAGGTANTGNTATNGLLPFPGPGGGGGGGGFNGYNNYCKPGGSGQSGQVTINFGTQIPTPTANVLRAIIDVPAGGGVDGARLLEALTTGTVADLYILYHTAGSGSFELVGKDSGGHQLFTSGSISFSANGRPLMVSAELVQQSFGGPNIAWKLHAIVPGGTGDVKVATGTIPGALGNFTSVKTNSASPSETGATGIGHIAAQYQVDSLINLGPAFGAYVGELAADRLTRLCADNGIPFELFGTNTDTPQMGPQPTDVLLNVLLDCMNVDLGQLFETRDQFGLGYQTRQNMQNQAQQVILDYSLGQLVLPLAPTDDDQMTRNDVIATRGSPASSLNNGSSFEAVLNSGPMSTQDPPNGVGLYQYTVTVNVFQDSQLQNFATWILTIGTLDEFRYPIITLDLTRPEVAGDVFGEIAGMDITDFLSIINPPAQLPQYAINQLAFGFSESLNFKKWTISINAVPEDPYSGANLPIW